MELFEIKNLSFTYPNENKKAIDGINLSINKGEFLVLCGLSASGKTTLLRMLKKSLSPSGRKEGEILFKGVALEDLSHKDEAQKIGFVGQSPENQIVTDKVWHELAFGLENLGYENSIIRQRVGEMAAFFGMEDWFYKDTASLSGGQKQILNLASVMAMQAEVLILDEPTSRLDPIAAGEFLNMLGKIVRELGVTVILAEHRLEDAFNFADRVVFIDEGKKLFEGDVKSLGLFLKSDRPDIFLMMPSAIRIWAGVKDFQNPPVNVREGRLWLERFSKENKLNEIPEKELHETSNETVIKAENVWFRYKKEGRDILKGLNLEIKEGEFFALMGGNGAGKTTTLKLIAGLFTPYRGKVNVKGKIGFLSQNPQVMFEKDTVKEDLLEMLKGKGFDEKTKERKFLEITDLCRLKNILDRHPYDISGGEAERLALAKILLSDAEILLLDEPTKGLDAEFKMVFAEILNKLLKKGITIIMVSHDLEFCAENARTCGLFFDGNVLAKGNPSDFFSGNSFYTTPANRIARDFLPKAITVEDVILACKGEIPKVNFSDRSDKEKKEAPEKYGYEREKLKKEKEDSDNKEETKENTEEIYADKNKTQTKNSQRCSKGIKFLTLLMFLAVPLTIFISFFVLESKSYNIISALLIIEIMTPFFLMFEGRKPKVREIVLISVICAIGVIGRSAFFMLPQIKPVIALTIISGIAFGKEFGFFTGAVTMLVSNILLSQGPWTPWQMLAMGLIGFISGAFFEKGFLKKRKIPICIFGILSGIFIYGGIMNPASAFIMSSEINKNVLITYYLAGLPADLVQAAATGVFLWFFAEPILKKLERIKTKYGSLKTEA